MELHEIGRISPSSALVAQFGDVQSLFTLASNKSKDARANLATKIGEVLNSEVSLREGELIADILIELMRQAEKDLRFSLSQQLAALENVPLRLVLHMANEDIDVAAPVLRESPVLGDFDLLYIIKSKSSEYWKEIAQRRELSVNVMETLAETKDFDTALCLAENDNIKLSQRALTTLVNVAQEEESDKLAYPLVRRDEISADLVSAVYKFVSEEIRDYIKAHNLGEATYDAVTQTFDQIVEEVASSNNFLSLAKDFIPEEYMVKAANSFKQKNMLTTKLMIETLRRGQTRSFIAQFAVYVDLAPETVIKNISRANGAGMAALARICDMNKSDFVSIYMLMCKAWNYGRLVSAQDIQMAVGVYNSMNKESARDIINHSL